MAKRSDKSAGKRPSEVPADPDVVQDGLGPDEVDMAFGGAERDMEDTPTADEAHRPEATVRYGMSGDAGGIMAPAGTGSETMDQDYSGGGSGMDDESANTTSRSGIGGGAGFSTSRATMGDEDGLVSFEAGRADAGGLDGSGDDGDAALADDADTADTAAEAIDTSDVVLAKHFSGAGTGASDVGTQAAGVTDDDIRSADAPQTTQLSNDEAMAIEQQAKKKKTGRRQAAKK